MPLPWTPSALLGTVLGGRWRLLSVIGEGGMGVVFAATNELDRSPVAVKILRSEFASNAHVVERFLGEADVCMRVVHPSVVHILGRGAMPDGTPYLVMELLAGGSLADRIRQPPPLGDAEVRAIVGGILRGLDIVHAAGLVHRDMKPENVILARGPARGLDVKLLDFGIAKVIDEAGGAGAITRTGAVLGTPAYMSPEQVQSAKNTDARSDLWSVGVLAYQLMTGRLPFEGATEFARISAILEGAPIPLAQVTPLFGAWQPWLDRALQKDRARRFQSAAEMAEALGVRWPHEGAMPAASAHVATAPIVAVGPRVNSHAPAAYSATAPSMPAIAAAPRVAASSTLGSPSLPPHALPPAPAPPPVVAYAPASGDLESTTFRGRSGIAPALVVAFVVAALIAGFALGFAAAKL